MRNVPHIIEVLDDQGFLALDDGLTLEATIELVQSLNGYPIREVIQYLNDNGHLCIDDDQFDEVVSLVENL